LLPIQVTGSPARFDLPAAALEEQRSDQMLTGAVPFQRDQAVHVLTAHLSEPPPSLCSRRPDLPAATDQVLARGMAKTPQERYESCRDFADALRATLGLAPYHPRSPASTPDHPQTQIVSPPPGFPGSAPAGTGKAAVPADLAAAMTIDSVPGGGSPAAADLPAAPAIDTSPALPGASEAVPSMSLGVAEEDIPAAAAMATATSLPTGKLGTAGESGRPRGEAGPPPADADGPASVADVHTADQRPPSIPGSGGKVQPTWHLRRLHAITLAGAALVAAAIVAFVLASSPGSPPTLTYSQFLSDVAAHPGEDRRSRPVRRRHEQRHPD
jgi:hypothetical protein